MWVLFAWWDAKSMLDALSARPRFAVRLPLEGTARGQPHLGAYQQGGMMPPLVWGGSVALTPMALT